ncbi:30S ribosomal protein S7 [Candidatus Gottesmanbacteria bacterium]|nr:30S ribosomal protein S7 [Candidatus Gottesmanbacteria bacterium]
MATKLAEKKMISGDPVYNSQTVARLINRVMRSGKKGAAYKAVYDAFSEIEKKGLNPIETFEKAINNVSPKVEVRSKRVGGAAYQVPSEVRGDRRTSLAIRWIIAATAKKSNKEYRHFSQKLAAELIDASNGSGEAVKKKDTTHKMAEANKVFSHFRW